MNLSDNKYFSDVMSKYFLILIEMNLYVFRQNIIRLVRHNDDKASGILSAMKEISLDDFSVICVNFDKHIEVEHQDNLNFIDKKTLYSASLPCDFLFIYGVIDYHTVKNLCNYYNPKFVFYC